jgi:3-methyladenine DNA glycosylase/8-oxoguanine DNA glycosylase
MTAEAIQHLSSADEILARLISLVGPCKLVPKRRRSPFEALVQAVVYQQLNGNAAATILGRVKALFPGRRFPTPEDLLATRLPRLRGAGLSRAKALALKDIAAKTLSGVIPASRVISKLSDVEIVERLTTVGGVGPWTVEMFLIFTLGRTDVWPVTDYGVRQGFARTYGWKELPTPKELLAHGEKWRPHRSTAAWYFWRAMDLPVPEDPRATKPKPRARKKAQS